MEFHDFPTIYSVLKQHGAVEQTADQFYARSIAMLKIEAERHPSHALAVEHNRSMCEWDWLRGGSPYFKVYPAMIPLLSGVGIEVPVDYLRLPFQAFADPPADRRELHDHRRSVPSPRHPCLRRAAG